MKILHGHVEHDLPDSWWHGAQMRAFVRGRECYRANLGCYPGLPILELSPNDVEPLDRQLAYGVFRDAPSVMRILRAFQEDVPLPPVQVVEAEVPGAKYRFRLQDGGHRFYAALAAGYARVPAVDVTHVSFSGNDIYLAGHLVGRKQDGPHSGRPTTR